MSLGDYLPSIVPKNPFKSREGHPFVQSMVRNMAEGTVGPKISQWSNEKFLGDAPPADPNAPNGELNSPQNLALQQFLQNWLQNNQKQ